MLGVPLHDYSANLLHDHEDQSVADQIHHRCLKAYWLLVGIVRIYIAAIPKNKQPYLSHAFLLIRGVSDVTLSIRIDK